MIIVDTQNQHAEVDENQAFTASPKDVALQDGILAMHCTEATFQEVRNRALQICPNEVRHTFGDWEDACIRGLLELHLHDLRPHWNHGHN